MLNRAIRRLVLTALGLGMTGCAADTGVSTLYSDVLTVSRQGATGFSSANGVRLEAIAEAQGHCASVRRSFYLVALNENKPPFVFGNFPRTEVRFMCLDPADPRLRGW